VTITNSGDAGSTLSGDCSVSGDAGITLSAGGGSYSVSDGSHVVTLACSTATPDTSYNATLSCTHDASNIASPATYPVTCTVPALPPAVFASTPASGATIDTTPGDVKVGDTLGTVPLTIRNTATAPAQNLALTTCALGGTDAAKFTVSGLANGDTIAAGQQAAATVACNDASTAATYNATYSCDYTGTASPGTATWNLLCEVRATESSVSSSPADGATITQRVAPGGSADFVVTFREIANEGVDGEVSSCTLGDTTNFALNTSLPATVPAGGSVQVSVTGTDPGDAALISTTLDCTYSDSSNPNGADVSYTLILTKVFPKVPTLNQWGLILLSLLMLGAGLVGFRRFAS
jgi:hypothetical protein